MTRKRVADYYLSRSDQLLLGFDREGDRWREVLAVRFGGSTAERVLLAARHEFAALIPHIPYIGGDENSLTGSLIGSVRCLALFRAMESLGKTAEDTGRVLYDAVTEHPEDHIPRTPPAEWVDREELMRRRRARAARSQERSYAGDWVYDFVEGDGQTFDYGYDFYECATLKFYLAQGAAEFLPYYCFLDYPKCELGGLGLSRTMTLAEGHDRCDFRFVENGKAQRSWPPPFVAA